jgi:hypothetical protein
MNVLTIDMGENTYLCLMSVANRDIDILNTPGRRLTTQKFKFFFVIPFYLQSVPVK